MEKKIKQAIRLLEDALIAKKNKSLKGSIRIHDDESITCWVMDKDENIVHPIYMLGQPHQVNQQTHSFVYDKSSGLTEKMYLQFILSTINLNK